MSSSNSHLQPLPAAAAAAAAAELWQAAAAAAAAAAFIQLDAAAAAAAAAQPALAGGDRDLVQRSTSAMQTLLTYRTHHHPSRTLIH
jgi:hypothetical protein